ncbi:MAG: YceI family protein [Cyclobacteriaceae bacterium]|nr:YceI family protein [Cyclobacteriaceae bacterium]
MINLNKIFTFFIALGFVFTSVQAQKVDFKISDESKMTIDGTSSLHGWTSKVNTIEGKVTLDDKMISKGIKKGDKIESVQVSIPVKSIESPRGAAMDTKTYNALKEEQHPRISFNLTDNKVLSSAGNDFELEAKGNLQIAGKTQPVTLLVKGARKSANSFSFSGSYKLNMKDYDMEPPSAMFGQIVTGEEVTVNFDIVAAK